MGFLRVLLQGFEKGFGWVYRIFSHHPLQEMCFLYIQKHFQIKIISYRFQQLADAGRKQLEQLMHQLQEQLQINLLQQTHLMQTNSNSERFGFCVLDCLSILSDFISREKSTKTKASAKYRGSPLSTISLSTIPSIV